MEDGGNQGSDVVGIIKLNVQHCGAAHWELIWPDPVLGLQLSQLWPAEWSTEVLPDSAGGT